MRGRKVRAGDEQSRVGWMHQCGSSRLVLCFYVLWIVCWTSFLCVRGDHASVCRWVLAGYRQLCRMSMLNAIKKSVQKNVMTVTSWYHIPEKVKQVIGR